MPTQHPIAACELDLDGLRTQRDRYRAIGAHAAAVERSPGRLVVRLGSGVDAALVEEAMRVERGCCPFFTLAWDPAAHTLAVTVAEPAQRPALDAIAAALGVDQPSRRESGASASGRT